MKSHLLSLVFTDLVDSAALKSRLGDQAALDLIQRHQERVRALRVDTGGREVDTAGDGFFLTFELPSAAVAFALRLQQIHHDEPELPRVRIGVHLGEVNERSAPDGAANSLLVEGLAVDLAGRIQSLARGDQVLMSAPVFEAARQRLKGESFGREITWVAHGAYSMKGIEDPVEIGEAGFEGISPLELPEDSDKGRRLQAAPVETTAGRAQVEGGTRSIAVLPLANLSGDPAQEYVADGVTDALIEGLARVGSELRVISRTSVMQYKGRTRSSSEIAGELGVEFLIEGTAQRQDDRVLIRVQLIEARADALVWAESYERDVRDFFSVQREIARAVAEKVDVALKPEREPLLAATRTVDPGALDLYLRAVSLRGPGALVLTWAPPVIELLERSVALDPEFAEAWVRLSGARSLLVFASSLRGSRDVFAKAQEAAQRALALDKHLGAAHAELGLIRNWQWDFSGARSAFERAVELSPSDPRALAGLAAYRRRMGLGRTPVTELLLEQLLRVAPLDLYYRDLRLIHCLHTREYERGIAEAERIREFAPEFVDLNIVWLYFFLGRPDDAAREMLAFYAQAGFDRAREAFAGGSEGGGFEGGLRALTRLQIQAAMRGTSGLETSIAQHSAVLGETEEAMTWLERAYEVRAPGLIAQKPNPLLDNVRSDPRFQDLLRRIGFPDG